MSTLSHNELSDFLEHYVLKYNTSAYIETDPIQIAHRFSKKEDIEIAAFLTATIAWGNRVAIIKSANKLMVLLENDPYNFIISASDNELERLKYFVYRTFNGIDTFFFINSLINIYKNHNGLEKIFTEAYLSHQSIFDSLVNIRNIFFEIPYPQRTSKHLANVSKNSSCKRLNMFLRWMVREDKNRVDFGIWKQIDKKDLMLPLDLHSAKVSRELGLLHRKQNDWKAVVEVTNKLCEFDANDPVKYDYALFGYSAFDGKEL
jgi:uncharacterized protein (TIGR02757 family)